MNPPNSSTSSSDGSLGGWRAARRLCLWTVIFLAIFDVGVNVLFAYPSDPKDLNPNQLELYFDYGRSMEGRLRRATRPDPEQTAPITLAGWYDPLIAFDRDAKSSGLKVTLYGNSQTVRLADALQKTSAIYSARTVAAPGSTANWAYGAYLRDAHDEQGEAVVLTIMPTNLPMIQTMSAMTWNTSFAMPYTADVFAVEGRQLVRHRPPYESFADYVATIGDKARWRDAMAVFARRDPFYDRFLMHGAVLDNSTIARLIRRGWGQRRDLQVRARSLNRNGYDPANPAVKVANAMVAQFAHIARKDGVVPVVHIVNSRGYGDTMYRALADTLRQNRIPYISTHDVVDPNDPRNYLSDGHFTDENDLRLAKALAAVLDRELGRGSAPRTQSPAALQ